MTAMLQRRLQNEARAISVAWLVQLRHRCCFAAHCCRLAKAQESGAHERLAKHWARRSAVRGPSWSQRVFGVGWLGWIVATMQLEQPR